MVNNGPKQGPILEARKNGFTEFQMNGIKDTKEPENGLLTPVKEFVIIADSLSIIKCKCKGKSGPLQRLCTEQKY